MDIFSALRGRSKTVPIEAEVASARQIALNAATFADTESLILLQQPASKLDIKRNSPPLAIGAGQHLSRFRGRGMDYQESRIYQAGDDIRNMDWRVTARAGRPHTKLYQEERERPVVIMADFGPTMFFGSRRALKSVVVARIAALLGWAAAKQGDRIGGLFFNGEHQELRPKMGKAGVLAIIRTLVKLGDPRKGLLQAQDSVSLNDELRRLRRLARPGSLVFLISDFYGIDEQTRDLLLRLKRHVDVVAVQVTDPLEIHAPPPARYAVTDGVQSGILDTRSQQGVDFYNHFFQHHHQALQALLQQLHIPLLQVFTTDDINAVMQAHFAGGNQRKSVKEKAA
jgi:uncharacterized protein (DUF58 family)